jgi:predicted anti-sigma-YlaC factor YlaD
MRCQEIVELVTDYLEGVLPPADTVRFEAHIADCVWCRRYLEQMRVTIRAVGWIDEDSLSPGARQHLLAAFSEWRR